MMVCIWVLPTAKLQVSELSVAPCRIVLCKLYYFMLPLQCQAASVAPGVLRLPFFDSFTEEEFDDDNDEVD